MDTALSQNRLAKLNRLVELTLILNSTLQLEPLLRRIMDAASEISESQTASILLMDEKRQELFFMAFTSDIGQHEQTLRRIPVPLATSIAGACVLENRTLAIDDVTTHPLHFRQADNKSGFQTRSLLAIPMRLRGEVIGVLEALNKIDNLGWTQEDIELLEILASQAAVAVENARLVSELREAYQELSQLDKMKNDFIAIASHELRTPLGVILGYASFLKEEAQGEASAHASAVLKSALRMRQVIEDMTNLRFLKMGKAELDLQEVPAAEVMMTALNEVYSMSEAQGYRLHYTVPANHLIIKVDRAKIVMALTNLLNNAMKYSEPRSFIEMTYRQQGAELWILVRDEGIGIEANQLERIFEEFYQVEDHMTRRKNGMGLGLSIVRAIVNAHEGRVWAESERDQGKSGTTFIVELPRTKPSDTPTKS